MLKIVQSNEEVKVMSSENLLILDLLAAREAIEEIIQAYPSISREDIFACIAYGAEIARDSND